MRDAVDGGADYVRVGKEDFLHLPGVDVVAVPDNHVLLAVHDSQVAVVVLGPKVPRAEPAVDDRLGGGLWPVEVALHQQVSADDELAQFARGQQFDALDCFGAGNFDVDTPDRGPDGAGPGWCAHVVERCHRGRFGQPVAFVDFDAEDVVESVHDGQGSDDPPEMP